MKINEQLPPGIDYVAEFHNPLMGETRFELWSKYFWNVAKQTAEDSATRQQMFRLLWLGDWLATVNGWKKLNIGVTPLNALHSTLMICHNLSAAQASSLSPEEMNEALSKEWQTFDASHGVKDFKRQIEKKLDWLDSPWRVDAA